MLTLAKLLRSSLWRGTFLSHKDEGELINAFLHKYPLNNDTLDSLLCSFLHFYSSRTGIWSVSLNENDLMRHINNKRKKKKLWYLLSLKLSRNVQMTRNVWSLIQKVTLACGKALCDMSFDELKGQAMQTLFLSQTLGDLPWLRI